MVIKSSKSRGISRLVTMINRTRIECGEDGLFQTGRLTLGYASKLADMPSGAFRQFLKQRDIPLYSYDVEDFALDMKNLRELGRLRLLSAIHQSSRI